VQYDQVTTDCVAGQDARLVGREAVCSGLAGIFPAGFASRVAEVHEADVDVGITVVAIHGVFAATDDGEVLGFDRTFVLQEHGLITNDHIVIREAPDWQENVDSQLGEE
jgi:hypothetical protein